MHSVDLWWRHLLKITKQPWGEYWESFLMFAGCPVFMCLSMNSSFLRKAFYNSTIPPSVYLIIHLYSEDELTISNWTEKQAAYPFVFGKCPLNSQHAKSSCETFPGNFSLPSSRTSGLRWSITATTKNCQPIWTKANRVRLLHPVYQGQTIMTQLFSTIAASSRRQCLLC